MKALLLGASHGLALALGWILFFPVPKGGDATGSSPAAEAPIPLHSAMPADPTSENAILRATSADFRALWKELHLSGDVQGRRGPDAISVFMDWCARDPEGAIVALKDTFQPAYAHNYLLNAVGEQGAHLADPLLRHWRDLVYVKKVSQGINTAIGKVAIEDPRRGAELLAQLPPSVRDRAGGGVTGEMSDQQLFEFVNAFREAGGLDLRDNELARFWEAIADRVTQLDPEDGLEDWFPRLEGMQAHSAFAHELTQRAIRFERWDEVLGVLRELDEERREWTLASVGTYAGAVMHRPGQVIPLLEASARSGDWGGVERMLAKSQGITPPDPPRVYLDWALGPNGPADDPVAIQHAVALALRADREAAFGWIEGLGDETLRQRVRDAAEQADSEP